MINTNFQHISKLERNIQEPTVTTLRKLMRALNTTFEEFYDGVSL